MAGFEEIKKLSPEERIEKLKKLEEERKKEIEEAHKLITESIREVEEAKEDKLRIPVPQLKSIDTTMLFGDEEKRLFKMKRYSDVKSGLATLEDRAESQEANALEQKVRAEKASAQASQASQKQYGAALQEIRNEFYDLRNNQNWGQEERNRFYNAQEKLKDIGERYESVSNYVSNLMSVGKEMENKLRYVR